MEFDEPESTPHQPACCPDSDTPFLPVTDACETRPIQTTHTDLVGVSMQEVQVLLLYDHLVDLLAHG